MNSGWIASAHRDAICSVDWFKDSRTQGWKNTCRKNMCQVHTVWEIREEIGHAVKITLGQYTQFVFVSLIVSHQCICTHHSMMSGFGMGRVAGLCPHLPLSGGDFWVGCQDWPWPSGCLIVFSAAFWSANFATWDRIDHKNQWHTVQREHFIVIPQCLAWS